jgi:hypothetical protein
VTELTIRRHVGLHPGFSLLPCAVTGLMRPLGLDLMVAYRCVAWYHEAKDVEERYKTGCATSGLSAIDQSSNRKHPLIHSCSTFARHLFVTTQAARHENLRRIPHRLRSIGLRIW